MRAPTNPTLPRVATEREERRARQKARQVARRKIQQEKLDRFLELREQYGVAEVRKNREARRLAEELMVEYGGLVGHVLRLQLHKIPGPLEAIIDAEDLFVAGQRGLYEALLKFDRSRPGKFTTYAIQIIRYAMYHAISDLDMIPYFSRIKMIKSRRAAAEVTERLGREATAEEAAQEAGIPAWVYRKHRTWEQRAAVTVITEPIERYLSEAEGDPLEHLCQIEEVLEALETAKHDPHTAKAARKIAEDVENIKNYFNFGPISGNWTVKRDGTRKPNSGRAA